MQFTSSVATVVAGWTAPRHGSFPPARREYFSEETGRSKRQTGSTTRKAPMAFRPVMTRQEDDEALVDACRGGDRDAFRRLFERHRDSVYTVALHFTGDEAAARDVSQQVFVKLFTSIAQFRGDSRFTTWLYRVVANACADERKRRRRFVRLGDEPAVLEMEAGGSQEDRLLRGEVARSVREAVAELSPKLRMPILLRYVEGLSYDEIAGALGCSPGTVASRLNRGHKELARRLRHLRGSVPLGD
jgi:RNA polymerase sigma-70 factor, ECF subfamily